MDFGELEALQLILGNHISLLNRVVLLVPRSYLETSISVSAMCPTRLCVIFCRIRRVEARDFSW